MKFIVTFLSSMIFSLGALAQVSGAMCTVNGKDYFLPTNRELRIVPGVRFADDLIKDVAFNLYFDTSLNGRYQLEILVRNRDKFVPAVTMAGLGADAGFIYRGIPNKGRQFIDLWCR